MPTPSLDRPSVKITLLLYREDVEWFKFHFDNYTGAIREALRAHVWQSKKVMKHGK